MFYTKGIRNQFLEILNFRGSVWVLLIWQKRGKTLFRLLGLGCLLLLSNVQACRYANV